MSVDFRAVHGPVLVRALAQVARCAGKTTTAENLAPAAGITAGGALMVLRELHSAGLISYVQPRVVAGWFKVEYSIPAEFRAPDGFPVPTQRRETPVLSTKRHLKAVTPLGVT